MSHVKNLQLRAPLEMLLLRDAVGDNDLIQITLVDAINGVSTQDTVRYKSNYRCRTFLLEQSRSASDGVGSIRKIVDENGSPVRHISNKHHCSILPVGDSRRAAFLEQLALKDKDQIVHRPYE